MSRAEPLVIVGSRLQAISAAAIAAGAVIGLVESQPLIIVPAIGAVLFAISRLLLRVELHPDHVTARTWRGSSTTPRSATNPELGHRYLDLTLETGRRLRIEVPVEIRPNVRIWTDDTENDQGQPTS